MLLDSIAKPDDAVAGPNRRLDAAGGGPLVRQSVRRHCEHLERLAASLRKLDIDEQEIGANVTRVFGQYVHELVRDVERVSQSASRETPVASSGRSRHG